MCFRCCCVLRATVFAQLLAASLPRLMRLKVWNCPGVMAATDLQFCLDAAEATAANKGCYHHVVGQDIDVPDSDIMGMFHLLDDDDIAGFI